MAEEHTSICSGRPAGHVAHDPKTETYPAELRCACGLIKKIARRSYPNYVPAVREAAKMERLYQAENPCEIGRSGRPSNSNSCTAAYQNPPKAKNP